MEETSIIELILATAMRLTQDEKRLILLFKDTGITVNEDMTLDSIDGSPSEALLKLMDNLNQMPVIKISAKQIIRKNRL